MITDSRRLFGPNQHSSHPGAVLDVLFSAPSAESQLTGWTTHVREFTEQLGWKSETDVRRHDYGASLFVSAPADQLVAATEVNEQAWKLAGGEVLDARAVFTSLRDSADEERQQTPNLRAALEGAAQHRLGATFDDDGLTIGSGAGSATWSLREIPEPATIPWESLFDVPVILVTGSNGKTTTTRLVAAMWRAAGRITGWSCSDGVWVGSDRIESGDYSGPAGARAVLRDRRVEAAVLETARGGILRRGLAVGQGGATAAIITNVSPDHFGEYGITTLEDLVRVKSVVAHSLGESGTLVLNAREPLLAPVGARATGPTAWFSAGGGPAAPGKRRFAAIEAGRAILTLDGTSHDLGVVAEMPIAVGGTALHNIENMLGAAILAVGSGVPITAIRDTLSTFGAEPADNPGRLARHTFGDLTLFTDFAHNPDGIAALCATAAHVPASRRLLLLGQAGNRDDEQLRELVRSALAASRFDHVIIKEMESMLKGRAPGEIPRVMREELMARGMPDSSIEVAATEMSGVRRALEWARGGDVLVCPVHVERDAVQGLLTRMRGAGWVPGQPLP